METLGQARWVLPLQLLLALRSVVELLSFVCVLEGELDGGGLHRGLNALCLNSGGEMALGCVQARRILPDVIQ